MAGRPGQPVAAQPLRLAFELDRAGAERIELVARAVQARRLPIHWELEHDGPAPLANGSWDVSGDGPLLLTVELASLRLGRGAYVLVVRSGSTDGSSALYLAPQAGHDAGVRAVFPRRLDAASWRDLADGIRTGEPQRARSRLLPWAIVLVPVALLAFGTAAVAPLWGRAAAPAFVLIVASVVALAGPPLQIVRLPRVVSHAAASLGPSPAAERPDTR